MHSDSFNHGSSNSPSSALTIETLKSKEPLSNSIASLQAQLNMFQYKLSNHILISNTSERELRTLMNTRTDEITNMHKVLRRNRRDVSNMQTSIQSQNKYMPKLGDKVVRESKRLHKLLAREEHAMEEFVDTRKETQTEQPAIASSSMEEEEAVVLTDSSPRRTSPSQFRSRKRAASRLEIENDGEDHHQPCAKKTKLSTSFTQRSQYTYPDGLMLHVPSNDRGKYLLKSIRDLDPEFEYGVKWCRYCGAKASSAYLTSPWGPHKLCAAHCSQARNGRLDLSKFPEEPLMPISPKDNTENGYMEYCLKKLLRRRRR